MEAPLRTSSYLIPVKLESEPDKYMLIHGYTGAIDIATESLLKKIQSVASGTDLLPEMVEVLLKRGYITTKTPEEECILANKLAASIHSFRRDRIHRFLFIVNYSCNFRCPYCFENAISNKGKSWSHTIFSKEMVDRAYECMIEMEPDLAKHNKEITLYGGEPLMAENLEIVNYIVSKGMDLDYHFKAITNGYDLNLYENLLGKGMIETVQITLDGDKKYNDSRRFHYLYGGSYDKIIDNIRLALSKDVRVRVRSNVDYNNFESVDRLDAYLRQLKFYDNPNFSFYLSPLTDTANSLLTKAGKNRIAYMTQSQFNESVSDEKYGELDLSNLILLGLKNKQPIKFNPSYCGANKGMYILDPKGDIYCCLETIGTPNQVIGHYKNGLSWTSHYKMWKERSVNNIPECSHCRYALLCGGGCGARVANDLWKPYCNCFSKNIEQQANRAYTLLVNNKF